MKFRLDEFCRIVPGHERDGMTGRVVLTLPGGVVYLQLTSTGQVIELKAADLVSEDVEYRKACDQARQAQRVEAA